MEEEVEHDVIKVFKKELDRHIINNSSYEKSVLFSCEIRLLINIIWTEIFHMTIQL